MDLLFAIKVVYIYFLGLFLALLEIQIEGKGGWAENLPTWRPRTDSWLAKFYFAVTKKNLTGYHVVLNILLLLFFHLIFIWQWSWSWQAELEILAVFSLFVVLCGFLWFVLNPHYSLREFGPQQVWWHRKWLGRLPVDYYFGILATAVLFLPLILADPTVGFSKLITLGLGIFILTFLTIVIYPKAY